VEGTALSANYSHAKSYLLQLLEQGETEELIRRLGPSPAPGAPRVPGSAKVTPDAVDRRWELLPLSPEVKDAARAKLMDAQTADEMETYRGNIENFVGTVKLPVGVAGPLRVNGLFARGDYYVPLATTEAALVASYNRGAQLISEAGGCAALLLNEGVSRAPGFAFRDLKEVGAFVGWAVQQMDEFRARAEATTRHGKLKDVRLAIEGNHVYLIFEYTTGDAAGQNMVTIATQGVCDYILEHAPVKPQHYFVEANMSGDKKASAQSFLTVRGKKVTAEITVPADLVKKRLHTTARAMADYWRMSAIGGVLSGTIGVQGHYANGLAALFIACGQDAACVSESAVGVTRLELLEGGDLYASVTLPNLIVGTVGGGTGLPSQRACLEILGLSGAGKARALAEVAAGLALAGELSITAALAAGHFAQAHRKLARGKQRSSEE
jgi:hydroxymethylglutaryl-CoA reductase (NADPH)